MARVHFPHKFTERVALFRTLKAAVTAMPVPNAYTMFMNHQNISLADDETAVNQAEAAHDIASAKEKSAEMYTEESKNLLEKARMDHRKCCQNLKTIFAGSVRSLGDWGVTVNNENKIVYSRRRAAHAKEMLDLIAKHNSFAPGTSPLQTLLNENNINLNQNAADINAALTAFDQADKDRKLKEEKTEERNNKMKTVVEHLRSFGQYTVKLYSDRPHEAGELGFTIDSAKQKPRLRTITLEAGQEVSYSNVAIRGFITMLTEGEIGIRPKKKPKAPLISIKGKEKTEIGQGFSRIFIKNLSNGQKVRFTLQFHS
jgi:hypothetical protein